MEVTQLVYHSFSSFHHPIFNWQSKTVWQQSSPENGKNEQQRLDGVLPLPAINTRRPRFQKQAHSAEEGFVYSCLLLFINCVVWWSRCTWGGIHEQHLLCTDVLVYFTTHVVWWGRKSSLSWLWVEVGTCFNSVDWWMNGFRGFITGSVLMIKRGTHLCWLHCCFVNYPSST